MHLRVQKHAAIPYRIDSLNFLFYFLYFVHLSLFRSVDLNSKSLIQKNKNFQLCLYCFSFISLMPKVNVKHKRVNGNRWWVLFLLFSAPFSSLCMSRMIQQLNSWSLLFSSLCALTWIALPKNHKKIERKKIRHEWIHVFTRYALWSDGVRWASDSYERRWMKIFIRWFSRLFFDCCGKIFVGSLSFLYWIEKKNTFILALLILVTFHPMLLFLLIFRFCFDFL